MTDDADSEPRVRADEAVRRCASDARFTTDEGEWATRSRERIAEER